MPHATARAFWTIGPGQGALREQALPKPGPGEVRVRTLASGISRGTESLVWRGAVPAALAETMRVPFQEGAFPFPVKYGYCAVGVVEAGEPALLGSRVFVLHPHQDRFVVPSSWATPLPDTLPTSRAVLAANMETALNVAWDAAPLLGERILVIGAGVVGLLSVFLLGRIPGTVVTLVDRDPARAALAARFGVRFALPEDAPSEQELVVHASGSEAGLRLALDRAGFEARILEASWYGDREIALPLGGPFHPKRLRLVSTQVGSVAGAMRGRRSHAERMALALELLQDDRLDALLDGPTRFADLAEAMPRLLAATGPLCHVVVYD